jgi:hypothetical protein
MDDRLRKIAEDRYGQKEFLSALFDLALEEQWFDLQHLIQHDMAKAILADYSLEQGKGFLNQDIFYSNWDWLENVLRAYRFNHGKSEQQPAGTARYHLACGKECAKNSAAMEG